MAAWTPASEPTTDPAQIARDLADTGPGVRVGAVLHAGSFDHPVEMKLLVTGDGWAILSRCDALDCSMVSTASYPGQPYGDVLVGALQILSEWTCGFAVLPDEAPE